jgi:hypothetical protein
MILLFFLSTSTTAWGPVAIVAAAIIAALASALVATRSHKRSRELERQKHEWELERDQMGDRRETERERKTAQQNEKAEREERDRKLAAEQRARADQQRTEETELSQYQDLLCRELRNLRILDMAKPLDLRQMYVNLKVRDDGRSRFPREDERVASADGDPLTILERAHTELLENAASALSPEAALEHFSRIVVVGDPGAGKTTMLRHLALAAVDDQMRVPIYVELKDFIDGGEQTLLDHIYKQCAERYRFTSAPTQLASLLEAGKAMLLLDGLDETLGGASAEEARAAYAHVVAQVELLATRYPDMAVALTCRRAGWEGGLDAFRVLEVLDFSDQQVRHFVQYWFVDNSTLREDLLATLDRNARMRSLAANPLLLSLICIVFERDLELPERRAELYNRCVEVLLKEWDSHRGITRFSQFTTDRKRDLLEEVAWHFHTRGFRYFPEDDLLRQIGAYLPTIDIDPAKAGEVLSEIAAQYGLLKQQAQGMYGFLHLTLQEYFAAVAANERGREAIDLVAHQVHQPWWEEVALLLAGRMSDASPFLATVLRNPDAELVPDTSLAPQDNVLRQDLVFAARCLIGTPRVKRPRLREAIVTEVATLVTIGDIPPVLEEAAAVLGQLEDPAIVRQALSAAVRHGEPSTEAIVRGLSRTPTAHLAAALVPMLEGGDMIGSSETTRRALQTIVLVDPANGEAIQREYLRSGDEQLVIVAAESLTGAVPESVLPDLVHALPVGLSSAAAIARALESTAHAAIAMPLLELASDPAESFYHQELEQIVRSAVLLGGDEAVAYVVRQLRSGDDIFTFNLLAGMAALPTEEACAAALDVALDETQSESVRWGAIEVLGESREHGETRVRQVLAATRSSAIKAVASAVLVGWGEASAISRVQEALLDPEIRGSLRLRNRRGAIAFLCYRTSRLATVLREAGDRSLVPQLMEQYRSAVEHELYEEDAQDLAEALSIINGGPVGLAEPLLRQISPELLADAFATSLLTEVLDEQSAPIVLRGLFDVSSETVQSPSRLGWLIHRVAEIGLPQAIENDLLALHREDPLGAKYGLYTGGALAILAARLQRRLRN